MSKLFIIVISVIAVVKGTQPETAFLRLKNRPPGLSEIDALRYSILKKFAEIWHDLSESNDINQQTMQDLDLLKSFENFNPNITHVENSIDQTGFYYISTDWAYAKVDAEINNLNSFYETFLRFQKDHSNESGMRKPPLAWTDLAETYLQNTDIGVMKSLEKIHRESSIGSDGGSVFSKVLKVNLG